MILTLKLTYWGGSWLLHCEELPGLNICGRDLSAVLADFIPAWEKLHEFAPHQVMPVPRQSMMGQDLTPEMHKLYDEMRRKVTASQWQNEYYNQGLWDMALRAAQQGPITLTVCPGSQWPVIMWNSAGNAGGTYQCGICHKQVHYDAQGRAVTHSLESVASPPKPQGGREIGWISVSERLPEAETSVLILYRQTCRIGELRWEHPTFEETFPAYRFWNDPNNEGQHWDWPEVTHWMPLPELAPQLAAAQKEST